MTFENLVKRLRCKRCGRLKPGPVYFSLAMPTSCLIFGRPSYRACSALNTHLPGCITTHPCFSRSLICAILAPTG
jgi:hypothetical protein